MRRLRTFVNSSHTYYNANVSGNITARACLETVALLAKRGK